jgi:thioredoxin
MKIIVGFLFLAFSFGCYSQDKTSLSAPEFKDGISKNDIQILDVRTAGEYQNGHIQNALLANWNNKDEFFERVKYIDKTKPVYVYCLSGGRSSAAAKWMRENGYKPVFELQGGINAWKNASLPVEGASNVKQITMEEYQSQIANNGLVLVDFSATWCPPCKKMEPVVAQLQKDIGDKFKFVQIDAGAQTDIMKQMDVSEIPVFILYKNGKEIWRKKGVVELDEFKKQIASN